jgi:dinuclear metal center YbgI/SA1388 family protein
MAQSIETIENYLRLLLTPELFDDYAPNGLQIGGKKDIARLAFAVSATKDSIRKAIDWKADAFIVHHGIFWKHQGARTITGAWGERVKLCVKHDLNLIAYHLPLDAHPEVGNAVVLANEIGLTNLSPFGLFKKQPLGTKGTFSSPPSAKDLKVKLEKLLHHNIILASADEDSPVRTMGIITGGANNEWVKSLDENLDAYLTGEISEYNWHDAIEAGIHYFAGGHHATERPGIKALMAKVKTDFPELEVNFFDSDNPA